MSLVTPTPQTWTLRLKSHKTTVLLHINPLTTFSTIKAQLFTALQESPLTSTAGTQLDPPASPSDIQLGRPANIHDITQGFVLGEWERATDGGDGDVKGKGKAKGKVTKSEGGELAGSVNIHECPKGAGLKDNAVLAFRWPGDETGWEQNEDDEEEGSSWGVRIPSYEDQYGVENEGDVGGRREYDE